MCCLVAVMILLFALGEYHNRSLKNLQWKVKFSVIPLILGIGNVNGY